jgi:ribonuclease Y
MRFGATDYVVEYTTSKVKLPDDDIKGRIIGKEGRNITTFEELTGVELDLDSSQGDVIISSFDAVRREIAKLSLERLIADGRIQPQRIEELAEVAKKEVDHLILQAGEKLSHDAGVFSLPAEVIQTLGKFKYRYSY